MGLRVSCLQHLGLRVCRAYGSGLTGCIVRRVQSSCMVQGLPSLGFRVLWGLNTQILNLSWVGLKIVLISHKRDEDLHHPNEVIKANCLNGPQTGRSSALNRIER